MQILATIIIFGLCLAGMAIGLLLSNKVLKKGCSMDPDSCACKKEGKDPAECEKK